MRAVPRPTPPPERIDLAKALTRLRGTANRQELCDVAADGLVRNLGFDRALVVCTQSDDLAVISASGDDLELPAVLPTLADLPLERDAIRTRRTVLARTGRGVVPVACGAYLVAPILADGRAIGLLHADLDRRGLAPSDAERERLEVFAVGVGMAFERVAALEGAHRQAQAVRSAAAALEAVADGALRPASLLLQQVAPADSGPASTTTLARVLTPRELEVLELLASGARNSEIAAVLVVSEGTVKSHVKAILRKLHVTNRAEATAKFVRLTSRA